MGFLNATVNYMANDVVASTAFYIDVLGMQYLTGVKEGSQEPVPEFGDGTPLAFAMLQRGKVQIMLLSRDAFAQDNPAMASKTPDATALLFIEVDDIEVLYQHAKGKARMHLDIHDTFYGMREFSILDPDGYHICFAQRLPSSEC